MLLKKKIYWCVGFYDLYFIYIFYATCSSNGIEGKCFLTTTIMPSFVMDTA